MGYVKEPEGIDFIIESKPLTAEDDRIISEYIRAEKAKLIHSQSVMQTNGKSCVVLME
ncbi:MAG: hypothetical protein LBG92_00295 [Prevotellaceae bacterium]|jgi:hypothetical protein|nr:hypothetical protein [Prevotellaceae bacterium]